ncbi:MAG TPA: DUF898 family protein [Devosia sp.]|nr:DUF898 family protein [Devosia sp.]
MTTMTVDTVEPLPSQTSRVTFTASRWELAVIVLRGYVLMIPTIGLYRFWQATWKRRLYWHNTLIDGDPLEYTGSATQLLIGFLFALAFFVPIYIALFYLSTQAGSVVLFGYALIGVALWFLGGYAQYRGRDFRLSRTLWRGIRFNQHGSAWSYALRRFLWSLLMIPTLGLVYPFMAANLWRYRYRHTWFGDRQFAATGSWRQLAGPYYGAYFLNVLLIAVLIGNAVATRDVVEIEGRAVPGPVTLMASLAIVAILSASVAYYRARAHSRLLSTVSIGAATLAVTVRARDVFRQTIVYVLAFAGLLFLFLLVAAVAIGGIFALASRNGGAPDPDAVLQLFQSGTLNVVLLIGCYLVLLGAFGFLGELVIAFGWWKLLANGTTITNPETLRSVRATAEDRALIGEGLADALNVGAY